MKILVTGGAGFIGSHLVDRLLLNKHEVGVIDNFNEFYDSQEKRVNTQSHLVDAHYHLYEGDLVDPAFVQESMSSFHPDVVVNLAAWAGVRTSVKNPQIFEEVNIRGTLNVLEAVKALELKHFVFASSSSVYGNRTDGPFKETDSVDLPISPYAASKKSGELFCYTYHHLYEIPMSCLRFFTVYGPRQRPDLAIRKFMQKMVNREVIEIYGDGSSRRDFTYIDDIVSGIIQVIDTPRAYEIYNLGNHKPVAVLELVQAIESALHLDAQITHVPAPKEDVSLTYADISKAQKLLQWEPQTSLADGLQIMAQWFLERNT